jgi:hypothetical protein
MTTLEGDDCPANTGAFVVEQSPPCSGVEAAGSLPLTMAR